MGLVKLRTHPDIIWPPGPASSYGKGDSFATQDVRGILRAVSRQPAQGSMNAGLKLNLEYQGESIQATVWLRRPEVLDHYFETFNSLIGQDIQEIGELDRPLPQMAG